MRGIGIFFEPPENKKAAQLYFVNVFGLINKSFTKNPFFLRAFVLKKYFLYFWLEIILVHDFLLLLGLR